MLTFSVFIDGYDRRRCEMVHIDPLAVASVHETERQPPDAFWQSVAVISLVTGEQFTVYDSSRNVARQISESKAMHFPKREVEAVTR